jgi:ABC-type transport system substrate-binding protein
MRTRSSEARAGVWRWGLVAAMAVIAATLAGCGDDSGTEDAEAVEPDTTAAPEPVAGGNVTFGLSLNIDGVNPMTGQWNSSNFNVAKAIYDPMAVLNPDGTVEPYLLEAIEPNEDFTEWTLTTRDGVRWHNGDPLTPQQIAQHIKNIQLGTFTSFALDTIDAVAVVDEVAKPEFEAGEMSEEDYNVARRQIVVAMSEPWSSFPAFLATGQLSLVAHPSFETGDIDEPLGTGPFVLDDLVLDSHATVVRNDDYWREGLPYLDQIDFRFLVDGVSREQALLAGDVDMMNTQSFDQVPGLAEDEQILTERRLIADGSDGDEVTLLLNTQSGALADLEARKALQLATDREALNEGLYGGYYDIADAPFREDSFWYTDPGWPDADPEEASALVAAWEEENGPMVVELTVLTSPDQVELGQALAEQWDAVGITVDLGSVDAAAAGTAVAGGGFDAFMFTYFNGADPDENFPFWDPDLIGEPGELSINLTRYTSPTMDRVVHGARQTGDRDERAALYGELWKDFAENVPQIWLFHADWLLVAGDDIRALDSITTPEGTPAINHYWGSLYFTEAYVDR